MVLPIAAELDTLSDSWMLSVRWGTEVGPFLELKPVTFWLRGHSYRGQHSNTNTPGNYIHIVCIDILRLKRVPGGK